MKDESVPIETQVDAAKERGATATEYALLVALIAIIIVAGVTLFGSNLQAFFSSIGTTVGTW